MRFSSLFFSANKEQFKGNFEYNLFNKVAGTDNQGDRHSMYMYLLAASSFEINSDHHTRDINSVTLTIENNGDLFPVPLTFDTTSCTLVH